MLSSGVYFKTRDMLFVVYGKIGCKQTQQIYKTQATVIQGQRNNG